MAEPLTKEDRESIHRYALGMIAHARDQQEHDDALVLLQYEATVAALEAENALLRPLAEVGEFAVDERRAYKRYMAGEYGDWLEKRNAARQGVWDTADAILAQEEGGE